MRLMDLFSSKSKIINKQLGVIERLEQKLDYYENEFGINMLTKSFAGENVSVKTALELDTVYACIRDKSESIGQLPVIVKRNGKKLTRGKREYRILAQKPNDYMTMQNLIEMYVTAMESRGNFYMLPIYNTRGSIMQLLPFRFQENVIPQMDQNGNVFYTYVTNDSKPGIVFAGDQIIHIKMNTLDGFTGMSPISWTARTFGLAIAQENYLSSLMESGALPKGILTTDAIFDDKNASAMSALERIKRQWKDAYGGARNAGNTPILENNLKYQSTGLSPGDTELIKQRTFSRIQICSIFRVPAHRLGLIDQSSKYSLEENNKMYLSSGLMPLITKFENTLNNILPDDLEINIDERAFSRGDRASQVKALKDEFSTGAISMGEMREDLGRERIEGDDVHAIDTNNFTFGRLTDIGKLQEQNRLLAQQAMATNNEQNEDEDDEGDRS